MGILLFNSAFGFYVLGLLHSVAAFVSKQKNIFHQIAIVSVSVGFGLHSAFLIYSAVEKGRLPLTDLREALTFFAFLSPIYVTELSPLDFSCSLWSPF